MGTTTEKLACLKATKEAIKSALVEKGQTVEDTDSFRSYADKVLEISTGKPELENIPIALDFSNGNQTITAPDGYVVKSAIIAKPDTLIAENIAEGVNIAGIEGAFKGGGGSGESTDLVKYVTFIGADGTELYKMPVLNGDDCKNPITHGDISTPIKESDVQYNYTYSGWSLTEGGSASSTALSKVTEDRTVYAAFTASVRSYVITFFDDDNTTVLNTLNVPYGETPDFIPAKAGYSFMGWQPSLIPVVGDTSYYATWEEKVTFEKGNWQDIADICANGEAQNYFALGDSRVIPVTLGGMTHNLTFRIAGFDHDDLSDGSGKAGITVVLHSVTNDFLSNLSTTNSSANSYNAIHLTPAWKDMEKIGLPDDLTAVMKSVTKDGNFYASSTSTKRFLLSYTECGITPSGAEYYDGPYGSTYKLYQYSSLAKYGYTNTYQSVMNVTTNKGIYTGIALRHIYVAPGFSGKAVELKGDYSTPSNISSVGTNKALIPIFGFCI